MAISLASAENIRSSKVNWSHTISCQMDTNSSANIEIFQSNKNGNCCHATIVADWKARSNVNLLVAKTRKRAMGEDKQSDDDLQIVCCDKSNWISRNWKVQSERSYKMHWPNILNHDDGRFNWTPLKEYRRKSLIGRKVVRKCEVIFVGISFFFSSRICLVFNVRQNIVIWSETKSQQRKNRSMHLCIHPEN